MKDNYNIVVVSVIHQHGSAIGIYVCPFSLEPPSHLPPYATPLGCHRSLVWVPWVIQQIPTGCFTYVSVYVFMLLSPFIPTPCLPMSVSLFSMSASLFSSVQFSRSVVSDSLQPHESQHTRPPCTSPTPGVHSDSCPSSWWCHPAISSSVVPFSSWPQSLPASESFPMSHLFTWGGQSTGVSALASFLPKKSQGWPPSEWTGWISLQYKGLSRVFSNTTV